MTTHTKHALCTGILAMALATPNAHAAVCRRFGMPPRLPILMGRTTADFGAPSPACAEPWLAADLRADLTVNVPDFYGNILGEAVLSGAFPLSDRVWLSASMTALRYRQVINATVVTSDLTLGASTLGLHGVFYQRPWTSLAAYTRVLIPTDSSLRSSMDTGLEAGISTLFVPHRRVTISAGVSLPLGLLLLGTRSRWTFTPRLMADVGWAPARWIELLAGLETRVGTDPSSALELLAPKAAVRVHPGHGWMLFLQGMVPLAGIDTSLLRASLGVGGGW